APTEVLDSVIVHELCHRKEMNHSKRFYDEVYKAFPEYKKWNAWLKQNGRALMSRMNGS
ncbi:MAG: M48 family metallopeptidase, partial [Clostridia bacterium]|nr:M48 family metallopeptidase [Clostridia bacterium]